MKLSLFNEARLKLAVWNDARIVRRDKKSGKYYRDLENARTRQLEEKKKIIEERKAEYAKRSLSYMIVDKNGNTVGGNVDEELRILRAKTLETESNYAMSLVMYGSPCPNELLDEKHIPVDLDGYLNNDNGFLDLWIEALETAKRKVKTNRRYYERKVGPNMLEFHLLKLRCELEAASDLTSLQFMREILTESMGHDRKADAVKAAEDEIWALGCLRVSVEELKGCTEDLEEVLTRHVKGSYKKSSYEEFELPELIENLLFFAEGSSMTDLYRQLTFMADPERPNYDALYRYHLRYESCGSSLAGKKIAEEMNIRINKMYSGELSHNPTNT